MCATVEGRCLEYLVCITLTWPSFLMLVKGKVVCIDDAKDGHFLSFFKAWSNERFDFHLHIENSVSFVTKGGLRYTIL